MASPRVLSIQSHVVHGYVGNKSAVFPLQVRHAKHPGGALCHLHTPPPAPFMEI